MKKKLSIFIIIVLVLTILKPVPMRVQAISRTTTCRAKTELRCAKSCIKIYPKKIIINKKTYSKKQFNKLLKCAVYKKKIKKQNAVVYVVPYVGKILVCGAGAIIIGSVALKVSSWTYKSVKKYFSSKKVLTICKIRAQIPKRLIDKNGNVDLGKFNKKVKGKKSYEEKGGWKIDKDTSVHGGSKWKLLDPSGKRKASLDEKGKILRK